MNLEIFIIANPMIRISRYPNAANPFELSLGPKRKPAFDALNSQFEACARCNDQMKVIGHQHKRVKQIALRTIPIERLKE
jgi:hypothetical protein